MSDPLLLQFQTSLDPYIKPRQEAERIRHLLGTYLEIQLNQKSQISSNRPLSLLDASDQVKLSSASRGLRREYLKCAQINIKARQEYELVKLQRVAEAQIQSTTGSPRLSQFLSLVKQRQKKARLTVLQDYIDRLTERSVNLEQRLDKLRLCGLSDVIPRLPKEVISIDSATNETNGGPSLQSLVPALERAVLSAKANLKREKQAFQSLQQARFEKLSSQALCRKARLYALDRTRVELISWVERELAKAGEIGAAPTSGGGNYCKEAVNDQLREIKAQYTKYTEVRRQFLYAMAEREVSDFISAPVGSHNHREFKSIEKASSHILPPLRELVLISNEQKSFIHQKSHLTSRLANEHKEMGYNFERLANESHLLPSFPLPTSQSNRDCGNSITFAEQMSESDIMRPSYNAKAWTFAASSAAENTKDTVLEHFEGSSNAIEGARKTLASIDALLERSQSNEAGGLWSLISGNVGVLGRDEL